VAIKRINEEPKITDTILFDIKTPDADGCFLANPYKVDKVEIFFIERIFTKNTVGEIEILEKSQELERLIDEQKALICDHGPIEEFVERLNYLENELENTTKTRTLYYDEAKIVALFGDEEFPAWLSTDTENAFIQNIPEDDEGNAQFGHFQLTWEPLGVREGDYFICWRWTPNPAGESLAAHAFRGYPINYYHTRTHYSA
jgi:hypothetical protein